MPFSVMIKSLNHLEALMAVQLILTALLIVGLWLPNKCVECGYRHRSKEDLEWVHSGRKRLQETQLFKKTRIKKLRKDIVEPIGALTFNARRP